MKENYDKFWEDISPFIKFGCLKDEKFSDSMKDFIIYKNLEGKYITLDEYVDSIKSKASEDKKEEDKTKEDTADKEDDDYDETKEENKTTVYYVTDEKQQSQYINMFKEAGMDALILTHNIDQPFISHVEFKNKNIRFQRIDADITDDFKDETKKKDMKILKNNTEAMTKLFRKVLGKEKLEVKVEKLKNDKVSSVITLSEESRRMQDMMRMYNLSGMDSDAFGGGETLVLNANHKLVQYIITNEGSEHTPMICEQLYDLALLGHKPLDSEAMTKFIQRSNEIMMRII